MDDALIEFRQLWESDSPWLVTSTSGTTSGGKLVTLSKRDMRLSALATLEFLGLDSEGMVFVSSINPAYIGGKMMILRSMLSGARLVQLKPSLDPLVGLPARVDRVDLMAIVPAQVEKLLEHKRLPRVFNIIIGGAPLPEPLEHRLLTALPDVNIYSTYGMTETCSHVALRRLADKCYRAMPGVTFTLDEDNCLVINHPQASWSPLTTRDVVSLLSPREMQWLGRADNVINTGGIKVHPEELEAKIAAALDLPPFYITSKPHPQWGEALVMVVENSRGLDAGRLSERLRQVLPPRLVPKTVTVVDSLKRTPTGKVIRTC